MSKISSKYTNHKISDLKQPKDKSSADDGLSPRSIPNSSSQKVHNKEQLIEMEVFESVEINSAKHLSLNDNPDINEDNISNSSQKSCPLSKEVEYDSWNVASRNVENKLSQFNNHEHVDGN